MPEPIVIEDEYFWLRDDKRKDEEVLALLRDENAYTEQRTAHLDRFRATLYDEMLGHIKEDDDTHPSPSPDGPTLRRQGLSGSAQRLAFARRARSSPKP